MRGVEVAERGGHIGPVPVDPAGDRPRRQAGVPPHIVQNRLTEVVPGRRHLRVGPEVRGQFDNTGLMTRHEPQTEPTEGFGVALFVAGEDLSV